jgi:hypothetical protein
MVGALDRISHQPKRYAQICVYRLGRFVGFVLSVNDPSSLYGCPDSAIPNPVPLEPCCHQKKSPQRRVDHSCIMP